MKVHGVTLDQQARKALEERANVLLESFRGEHVQIAGSARQINFALGHWNTNKW